MAGGIIISTEPDEYVIAGTALIITFVPTGESKAKAGIVSIQEGTYNGNQWIPGRVLNGDESHQGRHLRIPVGQSAIQRIQLYRYQ